MKIERTLLEAYARGEITRREMEERTGETIRFGQLLALLHEHGLRLPRVPSDPASPGVKLLRQLAAKAAGHAR